MRPGDEVTAVRRRFLVLTALRWAPVGLGIPVLMLLALDRGLSLSQVGLAVSAQGMVVLLLELPTGGLADAMGRRPVLLLAGAVGITSTALLVLAHGLAGFAVAFMLQGVYRALDSGPLEAWFVDAVHAVQTDAVEAGVQVERGLSRAGAVVGVSLAAAALAGGVLVALGDLGPVDALVVPLTLSLLLQVVSLVGVLVLMTEVRHGHDTGAALRAAREAPQAIVAGVRMVRTSRVLMAIVAVELLWGFGSTAYESLLPVRLAEIVPEAERAAVLVGPTVSVAWLLSALGAAAVPMLSRRIGTAATAALLRVAHGLAVALMGLFAGVVGVVVAYLACYLAHGASNPAHMTLLHRQVQGSLRATAISVNSMFGQAAGALGSIVLTALADGTSAGVAMYLAAGVLAVAAPLYLPAWRQERSRRDVPAVEVELSSALAASDPA